MKPASTEDVLDLVESSSAAAAIGAAMELGLFWLIRDRALSLADISQTLGIPVTRCQYWTQLLCDMGLLEQSTEGYQPSTSARTAILDAYSHESWALIAQEARERSPALRDLALRLRGTHPARASQEAGEADYVKQMSEDPDRARRFTRMLYEIHKPLSETVPQALDMSNVNTLMDLGGGSGVMSLGLLRHYPHLTAVVVDVAPVCAAGREIARENSLDDRISYHPGNLLDDELPSGFDMVLECDVNVYSESLFRKIHHALNPGGRFVAIDFFAPAEGIAPPSRVHWALEHSMRVPDFCYPTMESVKTQLTAAGFQIVSEGPLPTPAVGTDKYSRNLAILEARK